MEKRVSTDIVTYEQTALLCLNLQLWLVLIILINKDRDVKFSFAQNTFSTSDMSLETIGFHFSVVKKNHIRYKEHLKLIRKDNF